LAILFSWLLSWVMSSFLPVEIVFLAKSRFCFTAVYSDLSKCQQLKRSFQQLFQRNNELLTAIRIILPKPAASKKFSAKRRGTPKPSCCTMPVVRAIEKSTGQKPAHALLFFLIWG
ncbi:MAG: hypothetical protein WCD88_15810, partial [Desulfobacterales bacterium]